MKALRGVTGMFVASSLMLACSTSKAEHTVEPAPVGRASQPLKDAQVSGRTDVVAVFVDVQGTQSWCTGIVIEPSLVVTAEHCLGQAMVPELASDCATASLPKVSTSSQAWVFEGENAGSADSSQVYNVAQVKVPANATRLCGQDIALLELASPLASATLSVITPESPSAGAEFLAVGYGTDGAISGMQRQNGGARVVCVGTQCSDARVDASELLASSNACEGDSGSPAIDLDGRTFAMAVRSSADCTQTAYLQLGSYFAWMASVATATASAQGRDAPGWAVVATHPNDAGSVPSEVEADIDADVALPTATPATRLEGGGGCAIQRSAPHRGQEVLLLLASAMFTVIQWRKRSRFM